MKSKAKVEHKPQLCFEIEISCNPKTDNARLKSSRYYFLLDTVKGKWMVNGPGNGIECLSCEPVVHVTFLFHHANRLAYALEEVLPRSTGHQLRLARTPYEYSVYPGTLLLVPTDKYREPSAPTNQIDRRSSRMLSPPARLFLELCQTTNHLRGPSTESPVLITKRLLHLTCPEQSWNVLLVACAWRRQP